MPRPKKNLEEQSIKFTLRLEKDLMSDLNDYCERNHITKAKALKNAISLYIGYTQKNKKD